MPADDLQPGRGPADGPAHLPGSAGMDKKTALAGTGKQHIKIPEVPGGNGPAVALGLYQPALTVDKHLPVQAAIAAVRRVALDLQPLPLKGQQQQLLKNVGINFAQVTHPLAVAVQFAQALMRARGGGAIATVPAGGGRLPAKQPRDDDKQDDKPRGQKRIDRQQQGNDLGACPSWLGLLGQPAVGN